MKLYIYIYIFFQIESINKLAQHTSIFYCITYYTFTIKLNYIYFILFLNSIPSVKCIKLFHLLSYSSNILLTPTYLYQELWTTLVVL